MCLVSDRIEAASKEWWNTPRGLTLNRTQLDWRAAMQSVEPESWKPVVGYEGFYNVSDQGRVRSLDRTIVSASGVPRRLAGREMLWSKGPWHQYVTLTRDGKSRRRAVHHLVLEAFVGPRPEGLLARHLNDDRDDNSLPNLAYGTPKENMQDKIRNGHHHELLKTHCPQGHEYAGRNLMETKNGWRKCRECHRIRSAERYARSRAVFQEGGNRV